MTGKRFTTKNIICSNYCVWDNNDKPYGNDEVVELLNELHKENDVLKQELKTKAIVNRQYEELQILKKENAQFDILIKNNQLAYIDLEKENEHLKQQEKRLYKYFRKCFDNVSEQGFRETWEVVKKYD